LLYYALIGLLAGSVGRAYVTTFGLIGSWFRARRLPRAVKPAVAGLAVGCLGLVVPGALGTGYGWVQAGLDRDTLLGLPLWMVVVLPFAKILATSLSIGSGGSGGIFGPGMVIGGLLGAGVWRVLEPIAPGVPLDPSPFVIVAMMALFGSIAHAPLAVMLMVAEMTDNLAMLGPAMLAIGIATVVVGDRTIYTSQVRSRAESPAHRFRFALPLLAAIPAGDAARTPRLVLGSRDSTVAGALRIQAAGVPGAPVIAADGTVLGAFEPSARAAPDDGQPLAEAPLDGTTIAADEPLDVALETLAQHHRSWAPVLRDGRLVGVLSARDVLSAYRRALAGNLRRVETNGGGAVTLTAELDAVSPLVGVRLADAAWPAGSVLVSVVRDGALVVPRGDLVFRAGDEITAFVTSDARAALDDLLRARAERAVPVTTRAL
jgi:CBS domain-containing protein